VTAVRVLAVIQARLGSTRLPGKALLEVAGRPMLAHVIARARAIAHVDRLVIATTVAPEDEALAALALRLGAPCVRGSVDDVLDRFHQAWREHPADAIVRVTGDCPLLDPLVSGLVLRDYLDHREAADYVSNVEPPTYPDGLDTEVVSAGALERAWREARRRSDREHVTTYVRDERNGFRLRNVSHREDLSGHRWTVDEPRDLDFVRAVYRLLSPDGARLFGMGEVLDLVRARPELARLNDGIARNEGLERSRQLDLPGARPRPGAAGR
jgi:spore coat polysaccharide biosynthesis protein SpsF (cytidylyltransferase family)